MIANDQPDIILLTEVIPKGQKNPIATSLLELDGYSYHANFNPDDENLGLLGIRGVMIYFKQSLHVSEVEINVDGFNDHIWIEISNRGKSLLCGCIYRSPSDIDKAASVESTNKLNKLIKIACNMNSDIVIAGDFNYKEINWIHDYAPPNKQHLIDFIQNLQDCFLYQHVTEPTRFREGENPNLLDLILSKEENLVQDLCYLPPLDKSDHVCLRFSVIYDSQSPCSISHNFDVFKADYDAIQKDLDTVDWNNILIGNFNEDYTLFMDILSTMIERHAPLRKMNRKKKNIYASNETLRLQKAKRRSWNNYKKTNSTYQFLRFKKIRNKLRATTRKLRNDIERNISKNAKSNPKTFWKYVNSSFKITTKNFKIEQIKWGESFFRCR